MNMFEIKTKILCGNGSLSYLGSLEDKRVLIICDPFMQKSGLLEKVKRYLTKSEFSVFDEVVPDPPIEAVVKGVDKAVEYRPDVVIALGGGSAIDEAKAIMYCARNIGKLSDTKFIAIPTTSGTGSEVTSFAVITDSKKGIKYPLVSDELLPNVAILASELVKSVPPAVTADTGIDVLTHATEAYVSTAANDFSDALAEKAVAMVFEYLFRSYKNADDDEAKEKMHNASCIAGMAFNIASLGLNHALSHNISAKLHIPHGRANALLLPHVIEFNSQNSRAAQRYARLARFCGISAANTAMAVKGLIGEIKSLERKMDIPSRLCGVNIDGDTKTQIIIGTLNDTCILTNPQSASQEDIMSIINKIMG